MFSDSFTIRHYTVIINISPKVKITPLMKKAVNLSLVKNKHEAYFTGSVYGCCIDRLSRMYHLRVSDLGIPVLCVSLEWRM